MPSRSINTRLTTEGAQRAAQEFERFGERGQRALKRLEDATTPASRGLLGLDRASGAAQSGVAALASSATFAGGPIGGFAGQVTAATSALGRFNPAVAAIAAVTVGVAAAVGKAVSAGAEYEQFLLRTEQQLKATGNASGLTAGEIDKVAFALARSTGATIEGARRAASELLTFRAVAGDTFREALSLSQDLAATGIGSLESNVIQLAKALQDPVKGVSALSEAGVQFTQVQKDAIEAMVEVNDVASAQRVILEELKAQVGGAGQAEAGGLVGIYQRWFEELARSVELLSTKAGLVQAIADGLRSWPESLGTFNDWLEPGLPTDRLQADLDRLDREIADRQAKIDARRALPRVGRAEVLAAADAGEADELARLIEQRRQLVAEIERQAAAEDRAAAEQMRRRREEAEAQAEAARLAKEREEADKRAAEAEKDRLRERASALTELARLEESNALIGLGGVERLEVLRDQAMEKHRERLEKQVLTEGEFNEARLLEEEKFQKEKAEIERKEREKAEQERQREDERAAKEREREAEKAAREREREMEREAERQAEIMQRPFENFLDGMQDSATDFWESFYSGGVDSLSDLGDAAKRLFARLAAEWTSLQIFQGGAFGFGGARAGGAAGAPAAGLGGGAGSLLNLGGLGSSLFGTGGMSGALNSFGAMLGFSPGVAAVMPTGAPLMGAGGMLTGGGATSIVPGQVASGGLFGTTTLGSFLGGAGLGFGAGTLFNSLIGGQSTGGMIGSGVGGLAGAAIGSIIPGVGTILGGLLGGLAGGGIGGLFGPGKSVGPNATATLGLRDGQLYFGSANADNGGSAQQAGQLAEAVAQQVNAILDSLGAGFERAPINRVGSFGGKLGVRAGSYNQGRFDRTFSDAESAVAGATLYAFERGQLTGVDADLGAAIKKAAAISEDLEDFAANLGVAKAILDESLFDAEELTAAEQALKALNEQFDDAADRAEKMGLSIAKLEELRDQAIADLTEGFDEGIRLQILGLTDPLAAALEQHKIVAEQRLKEAEALGADLVEVEKLNALERQRVVEQAGGDLKRFFEEVTTGGLSGLSPASTIEAQRAAFEAAAAQGNVTEINRLGRGLLETSRDVFASSAGYQQDLARVRAVLEGLLGDVPGFATGTASAPPGLAWVGERGPELVSFRGGERVYSAGESRRMTADNAEIARVNARGFAAVVEETRELRREVGRLANDNRRLVTLLQSRRA